MRWGEVYVALRAVDRGTFPGWGQCSTDNPKRKPNKDRPPCISLKPERASPQRTAIRPYARRRVRRRATRRRQIELPVRVVLRRLYATPSNDGSRRSAEPPDLAAGLPLSAKSGHFHDRAPAAIEAARTVQSMLEPVSPAARRTGGPSGARRAGQGWMYTFDCCRRPGRREKDDKPSPGR